MVSFILEHKDFLRHAALFATGTTGSHIEKEGFSVTKLFSGSNGGDTQIAALVPTRGIDLVIFFRDPQGKTPHEPDVQMLDRQCDVHNVPVATNSKSGFYLF